MPYGVAGLFQCLVFRRLKLAVANILGGSNCAALSCPTGRVVIFPFLVAEQNADALALELSFVPIEMVSGICFFETGYQVVEALSLTVKILIVLVRNVDAQSYQNLLFYPSWLLRFSSLRLLFLVYPS